MTNPWYVIAWSGRPRNAKARRWRGEPVNPRVEADTNPRDAENPRVAVQPRRAIRRRSAYFVTFGLVGEVRLVRSTWEVERG